MGTTNSTRSWWKTGKNRSDAIKKIVQKRKGSSIFYKLLPEREKETIRKYCRKYQKEHSLIINLIGTRKAKIEKAMKTGNYETRQQIIYELIDEGLE